MANVRVWPITLPLWLLFFKHLPTVESTWNCSLKAQTYYGKWDWLTRQFLNKASIKHLFKYAGLAHYNYSTFKIIILCHG